jgi:hypothetical protein
MNAVISRRARSLRRVLFLSPHDYSYGRFCEEFFNSIARNEGLNWLARSRAVLPERELPNRGLFMDPAALDALRLRGAAPVSHERRPTAVTIRDESISDVLIGIDLATLEPDVATAFATKCSAFWEPATFEHKSQPTSDASWRYLARNSVELLNVLAHGSGPMPRQLRRAGVIPLQMGRCTDAADTLR